MRPPPQGYYYHDLMARITCLGNEIRYPPSPTNQREVAKMQEVMPGIIVDPLIKGGKPVIKGTRIPVELIEGKIAGGLTYEEIMAEYDLKKEDILAAMHYLAFTQT